MKDKKNILIMILILALIIISFLYVNKKDSRDIKVINVENKRLNDFWLKQTEDLNRIIKQKNSEIMKLKKRNAFLMNQIKNKTEAKKAIKAPENVDELIKRFEALGYEVKKK